MKLGERWEICWWKKAGGRERRIKMNKMHLMHTYFLFEKHNIVKETQQAEVWICRRPCKWISIFGDRALHKAHRLRVLALKSWSQTLLKGVCNLKSGWACSSHQQFSSAHKMSSRNMKTSFRFNNLLEQTVELMKPLHLQSSFYYKHLIEQAGEPVWRQRLAGPRAGFLWAAGTLSSKHHYVHQQGRVLNLRISHFCLVSRSLCIGMIGRALTTWLNLNLQASLFTPESRGGTKSTTSLIILHFFSIQKLPYSELLLYSLT